MELDAESVVASEAGAGDFPVAACATCGKVVLAHLWLDEDGSESRRCVHCDAVLVSVRWVAEGELGELGYSTIAADMGCGRPGCGRGRCGAREG
jgi:hypothetical protein